MTWRRTMAGLALPLALALAGGACHDEEPPPAEDPDCSLDDDAGCLDGRVCEEVVGGTVGCFDPVTVTGTVFDTADAAPVEGARVVVQDANGAAVSGVAETDADGAYSVAVPAPRNPDGTLAADTRYTLRADAAGYLTFPRPPREAIPLDVSGLTGADLVVENATTDVGLIALPSAADLGAISGRVTGEDPGGTFVVAGGSSAVADADGSFTVFNVPAGTVTVQAYRLGANYAPETVDVEAGETTGDVVLAAGNAATAVVSGDVNVVNPGDGDLTSVILVAEETFDETTLTGEAPPGFRAGDVSNSWSIAGVPDGDYVALAAFGNDDLVRDPDTSIGGTEIQHLTVAGGDVSVTGFKVTGALAVISPGADGAEAVSGAPVTLTWEDDSSEDSYEVVVYDALGDLVWEATALDPGGSAPVTAEFPGPLEPGMYYQFRVTSIKDGVPISSTEDLKGVFFAE
ncbi:MAG TPA: hypothetical protein PLU22_01225 [Polyangiaceae bacterium]|nr:hypothetical protein [Polyangiaceae bacterium]